MELTGSLFAWIVWVAAIGLFVWVIIDWPRSARPGWLSVLRRVGYQLAVVILLLLAVGTALNDQYGWYANWGDLGTIFGATAAPGHEVAAGAAATAAAGPIAVDSRTSVHHTAVPLADLPSLAKIDLATGRGPANGQIRSYEIDGKASGYRGSVAVWFPASYTEPAMAGHRYPVIEAFHGVPGAPRQIWFNMHLGDQVATAVSAGTIADSVVVMPYWSPKNVDTECLDGGKGFIQMETFLTKDVTTWVEHHLRVYEDRSSWATIGLSAGAWCASMLTMLHPTLYSAAISLGGYWQPGFEAGYVPFAPNSQQARHYDLLATAHDDPPKVALWVQTSPADVFSWGTTSELLKTARAPLSVTADVIPNAGHRFSVWVGLVPQTLQWLGRTVPGFRPVAPAR
ncbi:Enterochelin esterase [Nakamurella panacisegetis]|uniref:Enterochelin esterase n=1 Tax=Nakamurella panacisegetis TaxID=1090615 RepID=A0A1H0M9N3_9ACTN|nr:alpha/beta hydrolase-fold protein [Nakamurella panacisegetis]SDO76820.1 Enterochelin esterase [Nakamurella panacisegetis]